MSSENKSIEPLGAVDRTKFLSSQAEALEDRLKRSSSSGKNEAETVRVQLRGGRRVSKIELDAKKLGLSKDQAKEITEAFQEATNAALDKYSSNVSRSIDKIINPENK